MLFDMSLSGTMTPLTADRQFQKIDPMETVPDSLNAARMTKQTAFCHRSLESRLIGPIVTRRQAPVFLRAIPRRRRLGKKTIDFNQVSQRMMAGADNIFHRVLREDNVINTPGGRIRTWQQYFAMPQQIVSPGHLVLSLRSTV